MNTGKNENIINKYGNKKENRRKRKVSVDSKTRKII